MTAPTIAAPAPDREAARRDAEIQALEEAAALAAVAALTARLARITQRLRARFRLAAVDPVKWLAARRRAAADLDRVQSDVAPVLERFAVRAAELGARHAGARLPSGHDPLADDLIRQVLDEVDARVRQKARAAAAEVLAGPVDTPARLDSVIGRVDAVQGEATKAAGTVITRAVAGGTAAVAAEHDVAMTWVSERDACLSCTSMAGAVAQPGGLFFPVREFAARMIPWFAAGLTMPPGHDHCRCRIEVDTPGLADALRREAERDVARGQSLFDSLPARLRALDVLLRSSRLPKSVQARAAANRARGRFSDGAPPPLTNRPRSRGREKRTG